MKLPTLYKKTSTGKINQWTIWTEDNMIVTEWGQLAGTIQKASEIVKEGKNLGRSNETTPKEQAKAQAKSQWEKKLKGDYVKTIAEAEAGGSSELVEGGILPMLAHRYDKHLDKIKFPAYVQPKLDGHRCIAVVDADGKCTLWSRTRKPIVSMPHIVAAVEALGVKDVVLDGELYNHEYRDKFEELTSLIRPAYVKDGHEKVQYHIYDIESDEGFLNRCLKVADLIPLGHKYLVRVQTWDAVDHEGLMTAFKVYIQQGYEGAIIRNKEGGYLNKRSYDLQKVKQFDDSEYKIVGVKEGKGKLAGHAIFECETDKGVRFDAKMAGAIENLKQYWDDPSLAVGKSVTVQYQGLTKDGKPRFPVALRIRKDI